MSLTFDDLKNAVYGCVNRSKAISKPKPKSMWEDTSLKELWYSPTSLPEMKVMWEDTDILGDFQITIPTGRKGLEEFDKVIKEYVEKYADELIDELTEWKKENTLSKWQEGWEHLDLTQRQKTSLQLKKMLSF